jgi:ribosomal protein S18 acetylase RimI-like enzyme
MELVTRAARPEDSPQIAALELDARAGLVGIRGGDALLAEQPAVADWAAAIADPQQRVFVSAIDDVVLGYLQLVLYGATAVVHQAYVDPGARELGFGSDMVEEALAAARDAGCTAIQGTALPGDRETKNLYERAGITARKIITWRRL